MTGVLTGNLFRDMPQAGLDDESFKDLLAQPGVRIERIVSHGHASAPGFWYDQDWHEWVIVLAGGAKLRFEDEADARLLEAGEYIFIPAHRRHRVDWTRGEGPTVWLAVHFGAGEPSEE